ncbi:TonB-dependent receptor domain-containing protein, partial [Novosphingobium sp.]|uniref:TonB-dependent receptor plug domain-containing protein n=1 Tax=Novosphingobium sp. TaxID=1874826 RepID=UPI00286D4B57
WCGRFRMDGLFMTGELRVKFVYLLSASLLVATPALAQDDQGDDGTNDIVGVIAIQPHLATDDTITVTSTGIEGLIAESGQSISVITVDQIEAVQGSDPVRLLERLPGVATSRNGPLGSATSVFVRGANSQQLLVTIDGVRVDDQAAPSGGFDFGTVLNGGVGRIELLRGSNSLAWGSDAIGGVLAVTSDDRPGLRAGVEYGANNTVSADAGFALRRDSQTGLALNGGYTRSDGISAVAGGAEPDGFRQWHVNGKGSLGLTDGLKFVAAGRYADSRIDFDGYPAPTYSVFADTPEYQTTRQVSGRAGLEYGSDGFELAGGVALSDTRRAYYDPTYGTAPNFNTVGRGVHADLKGRVDLSGGLRLDFGADADWARYSTTYDPRQTARTVGAHALLGYHDDRVSLTAGGRVDDHDRFGSHTTLGANGSFMLAEHWRVRASWGQGFKAPSLSQLYGYGANPLLQPETSDAYDAALEFDDGSGHFAVTVFRRDSSNLIDYDFVSSKYFNVGRTRAQGFELEGAVTVADSLTLAGAYTFLDATNRANGNQLARRPRHSLSTSIDWKTPLAGLKLGADFRLVGERFDDAGNFTPLDGYGLVSLRASVPVGDKLELYGRVENVTDQSYETAAGYGSYGRSAYAGVRLKW